MLIMSEACKQDSLNDRLCFTNVRSLHSNFLGCEPFTELNSPDIITLCEMQLGGLNEFSNLSIRNDLLLTQKD